MVTNVLSPGNDIVFESVTWSRQSRGVIRWGGHCKIHSISISYIGHNSTVLCIAMHETVNALVGILVFLAMHWS